MDPPVSPAPACRICQGEVEPLIRPCCCEGSMAYAHPYCLAEWIAARGQLSCEVCSTPYSFQLAVQDMPSLRSVRGAARVVALCIRTQVCHLCATLGVAGQIVACMLALTVGTTAIWFGCWRCVSYRPANAASRRVPPLVVFLFCFVLNIVPFALLLLYERFSVWTFIHEDEVADLPPVPPVAPPPEVPVDEVAAAALNTRFTNGHVREDTHSGGGGVGGSAQRYVALGHAEAGSSSVLQLLRKKVEKAKGPGQRRRIWDNTALQYLAKFLVIHLVLATAFVAGDAALQCLSFCSQYLAGICDRLSMGSNPVSSLLLKELLAGAPFSSPFYWSTAFVAGVFTLQAPLQLAAARLSRTMLLCCIFTRSALSIVLMVLVWATVLPVIVYACLFPFMVEGDAKVIMTPQEAWQILHSEHLLPFRCRSATTSLPVQRPLSEPLNVARALVFAVPDVWQGRTPLLFDHATCGLDGHVSALQQPLSQAAHFVSFCVCVLMRVCALPTWLTLVGTLRATMLWLLSGAFTVLLPYTSLGKSVLGPHDFFHTFLQLRGKSFWRTLCEIPALVALYTIAVGFPAFVTLFRYLPDAFPRSVSYLSFYTLTNRFSEFDFVYSWYRIIKATHNGAQSGLQRLFLSQATATPSDDDLAPKGNQAVERAAYVVCLLCANIFIGVVLEWASWNSWFPLLGLFLNFGFLSWLGMIMGGGLPIVYRRLSDVGMQATMLCFFGSWVTFKGNDVCVCSKLSRLRPNAITAALVRQTFDQQDIRQLIFLTTLVDRHHREPVVCSRELLRRITRHSLSQVATYPRIAAAAVLAVIVPLALCSTWHLDFATRVSTDYMALPLWFSLMVRWLTGAMAGTAWLLVEGYVLRTALFQRCLEFAPELILGTLSWEVVHAVFVPLAIHCGAVRLGIAFVEYFSDSAIAISSSIAPKAAAVMLVTLFALQEWARGAGWRLARRLFFERAWRGQPVAAADAPAPAPEAAAAMLPPQPVEHEQQPADRAPAAAGNEEQPLDVAAAAAQAEPEHPQRQPPLPEQPPALPQKAGFISRLQERLSRWAASECATDVVLVDYARSPTVPESS